MHLGLLKDYSLRFLPGDLSHSWSVSQSVCPLYFLGLHFDLIYSFRLIVECPFLGSRAAALDEERVFTYFLATSKGWLVFQWFFVSGVAQFLNSWKIFS